MCSLYDTHPPGLSSGSRLAPVPSTSPSLGLLLQLLEACHSSVPPTGQAAVWTSRIPDPVPLFSILSSTLFLFHSCLLC